MRGVPVGLERPGQQLHRGLRRHHRTELAAQVEGAAVDVHRADEGALAIGDQQLGMQAEILLLAHLDVRVAQHPQRGKRVEHVPFADAVLATAQDTHIARRGGVAWTIRSRIVASTNLGCWMSRLCRAVSMNALILLRELRLLHSNALPGRGMKRLAIPVGHETFADLRHLRRSLGHQAVVARHG